MTTLGSIIAEHPFFEGLGPQYLQLIAGCAKNVYFDEGEFIFREGQPAEWFYLVREGKVSLGVSVPGRGMAPIQTIPAGEILGWSWLFEPYGYLFNATAIEPVRGFAFDGVCLRGKCEEDHHLGYELMKRLASVMMQRLQATRLQLLDVYKA